MDDEDEQAVALAAALDSLRHMSRGEMKTVLLDGSNDPEYIATVNTLFSRDDVSQEQLVEIFKETLFANNAEASAAAPSASTSKQKKVYTSSEEEEVVVHRPIKKRVLSSSDESADSNETVNLAKVKKKTNKKEETKPVKVQKVIETISIGSSSDSETDRRKFTKFKEKASKEDVSKKPEAKKEGKSSKHEKESRKEHRMDKEPSRFNEESSRGREREKDKRYDYKSAARVDRKHSSTDRKDKTSKEEERKEEKRKAEKRRDEERQREKQREEKRRKEREEKREKERQEKQEKEREEKREKERQEKREKERLEKREKEREEKREREREEKREKEREEKREREREEKREKEREEKREKEREEKREKEREEKREKEREDKRERERLEKRDKEREEKRLKELKEKWEKEREKEREEKREKEREEKREKEREEKREKERNHSKEEASKRCDETNADEWGKSDKNSGDKEPHKSVSEINKDTRVKVVDQNLDTKLQTEVRSQAEADSVKVEKIIEVVKTEGDKRVDSGKNDISAVIDNVTITETAARSVENMDGKLALASGAGSADANIEPAIICDTSVKDLSAPVPGSANKPSNVIASSSTLPQPAKSFLTKTGSFEAAISTEITKEHRLEPTEKPKNQEASLKEICFPPDFKVIVPQVPLIDPDFKKYKKKFRLKRLKVTLYDVQKQKRDMQEGDKIHRAEERKRKKERHNKVPEKKEKYSERGTRILPFEKRPENADIYGRKREIVREKPKTETPTEKQKRFAELHKKEREKEEKKKVHLIHTDFRIPKAGKKPTSNLVENIISSSTPLAPPVKVSKMHFDKRRMVTSTAKEDSWGLTPAEEAALKKLEKAEEKKKKSRKDSDLIVLDDEMPDFGFQDQDDDNDLFPSTTRRPAAADQEDDADADSVGYPPTDTPPAPIKECEINDLSMGVVRLLYTHTCIELAEENATHADVIMQKCGRWFRSVEHEPYYQACPSVPEQTDEEFYTLMEAMEEDEDDVSFIGNVSNPDGDDDLQDSEITSTALDPDQLDEYCGAALLNAKLRVKPGDSPDCFKNILEVRRGCNYDKVNFQAKCLLCEEAITDKRSLGVHLRSSKHRTHLSETSLKLVEMSMKSKKSDSVSVPPDSKTRNKIDSSRSEKDKEKESGKEKPSKIPENKPKETGKEIKEGAVRREDVKRHRSRSRSPRRHRSRSRGRRSRSRGRRSRSRSRGRRSRSRSPHRRRNRSRSRSYSPRGRHHHRRSMSPGRRRISHVDESLGRSDRRRSRSPKAGVSLAHKFKETDDLIFKEKLTLVASGKWTTQLEGRWKLKEEEEAQLKKIFVKKRKNLEEKPEEHELYNPEWSKFWERRYQELSEENKDPDDYDYTPEWKVHWKGFSEGILDQEFASRMEEIRTKFGLDLNTLRALNVASAPPPVVTPILGHGPIPPSGHPVYNPLVPPLGIHGFPTGMPPMPIVPPVPVPIVGAPPLPVGPIPPTYPATMGYPAVAPPPLAPIVNTLVPPGQALASLSSTPLASTPAARTKSAEPPLVGRHTVGEDYEAKPMSISSGSDNAVNPEPPVPAVTVDDVKNTWLNYTGQKMTAAVVAEAKSVASNASSGKSQAFDYDGLDVVHVLRIMLGLEDELSFLAIQVQNYYQKAEKLEAEEKRKSFGMLSEADFVNLLKQCRDKFYSILKANVSPSDVMKKLNLAVFSLNALLESSACEKLRPAAPSPALVDQPKVSPKSPLRPAASALSRDSSSLPLSKSLRAMSNPIADALGHLPQKMLVEMSSIIAASLIAQGKDRLSDTELNSNLLNIFRPVLRHTVESPGQIDPKPTGQGSFSGLMSGTTESRLRKSGGSIPEDEGFGMTSFLPRGGGGGGGSWGRDGRNPIPEDQEKSDIRSTRENFSPFVNEPGPSKISKELGDLQAKSSELQTPSSQLYNPKDNEPYDPENEYGKPTLSCERRKSVGISPKKAVETVPTAVSKGGPHLPAGIANLIQKEKTARTLGAAGAHTSTNLDFRRPDRSGLRDDRRVNATSSISSISEIGEVKESKRYRRKSKKLKAETDYKHNSEHRKKRRRHSALSPERSTKRARDDRHLSRRHSDGMDRIPESRHAESHRKERHRGNEHRKRRSADGRELQKSEEHEGSHSRRHRRSKTKKKHKRKESTDSKVDGVSKHFWNESGSTISSEDNIPDNQGTKDKEEDETQRLGRHVAAYRASNVVEEGELICTSEEDFSDSPGSQEGNKSLPLQSEDIVFVSEGDDWDEAEG